MTADVTIDIETVKDALRIPNAALRFRPPETAVIVGESESSGPAQGKEGGRAGGGSGGTAAAAPTPATAAAGGHPSGSGPGAHAAGPPGHEGGGRRESTVYTLGPDGALKPAAMATGITDGRFTVVTGGDLKEGDQVIVGTPTTKVEATGRPPGMGRM
jgi:HlyD family secretion protein